MDFFQTFLQQPAQFLQEYALPFILVLGVLVFIHEWGHYIVARLCGVKVETFSIGFGREIFGWTDKKGTRWKVSILPLGGYVQMFGDIDPASAGHSEEVEEGEEKRPMTADEKKIAFFTQSVGKRSAIVFAGPFINYLFAVVLMVGLFATVGQPYTPPIAASLIEGGPADRAGIKPDDKIIRINDSKIEKFQDIVSVISLNLDKEVEVTVLRAKEGGTWDEEHPDKIRLIPELVEQMDRFGFAHTVGRIGVVSPSGAFEMKKHGLLSALNAALSETWDVSVNTLKAVGQMIIGTRSKDELGGILRIGAYAGEFAKEGAVALISFTALLSINLGLLNLLPIPMLDGGHLAFYAFETVKGKPMSIRAQEYALRAGLTFLLVVMVFATWNDLVQMKVIDFVMNLIS